MNAIEIKNLTRDYGADKGIFDLSFSVEEGEVFGFLGPNGAGKTTTIRHLMGFIRQKTGNCSVNGLNCWERRDEIQKSLGYIPGELSLFDDISGSDYLRFIADYRGLKDLSRMNAVIERFELNPKGKIKKMSKGMKQKVGIAAAFMHDPKIYILDEPTSGLDPLMQSRFIDLITEERRRGKTVLMSSHTFEEVEKTCRRVGIIRAGRLAAIDSVDALKAKQLKKYTVTFENSDDARKFCLEGFDAAPAGGNSVNVTVENKVGKLITALAKYNVMNLSAPQLALEEIFMQYYGGKKNA